MYPKNSISWRVLGGTWGSLLQTPVLPAGLRLLPHVAGQAVLFLPLLENRPDKL